MPATRAKLKLREAQFFLTHLRAEEGKDDPEAFSYYLSAFLAATDSVIDIGKKEAGVKKKDFVSWKATSLDETEHRLLEFMTDQRNSETHRKGASTGVTSRDVPVVFYPYVEPLSFDIFKGSLEVGPSGPGNLPYWTRAWIPTPEHVFHETKESKTPVLDKCSQHCNLLEKFLKWVDATYS